MLTIYFTGGCSQRVHASSSAFPHAALTCYDTLALVHRMSVTQVGFCQHKQITVPFSLQRFCLPLQTTPTLFLLSLFFSSSILLKLGAIRLFYTVPFGRPTHTLKLLRSSRPHSFITMAQVTSSTSPRPAFANPPPHPHPAFQAQAMSAPLHFAGNDPAEEGELSAVKYLGCLLYTSPSPRDRG